MTEEKINIEDNEAEFENSGKNLNENKMTSDDVNIDGGLTEENNVIIDTPSDDTEVSESGDNENDEHKFQEYFSVPEESVIPKVTATLKAFLELKKVDEELADIAEAKGDLPDTINSLEQKLKTYTDELKIVGDSAALFQKEIQKIKSENDAFEVKINKYDEQKYNVKSNKEYDEIVKSIESMFDEVSKNEKIIKDTSAKSDELIARYAELEAKAAELSGDLDEKKQMLSELDEEFKLEETALNEKRKELSAVLDEYNLNLYNRVNSKHKGEATAIVRKGNCSGCFNSIPPQRVIEIKTAEKIYTCQSCGRILISEELLNS